MIGEDIIIAQGHFTCPKCRTAETGFLLDCNRKILCTTCGDVISIHPSITIITTKEDSQ